MSKGFKQFFTMLFAAGLGLAFLPAANAVTQLSVGPANHSCAVTETGAARCWGFNSTGQLGNGTTTNAFSAVNVTGLTSGVAAVAAGLSHSCALTTAGAVKCWGFNSNGQLGDGSMTQSNVPVDVSGLSSGVTAISVGGNHSCALLSSGGVQCWGQNASGQLGHVGGNSNVPVDATGLTSGVAQISAAHAHTCARTTTGAAKCWGTNTDGRVGDGTNVNKTVPTDVTGLSSGVLSIRAGGGQSCALLAGGAAKCWGENENGQLGNNDTADSNVPVDVTVASNIASIGLGGSQPRFTNTCVVTTGGAAKCWGHNNAGQLGNGTQTDSLTAVDVTGLSSGVATIEIGNLFTCARLTSGAAKCWGAGFGGALGNGSTSNSTTPVDVAGVKSPQTITFPAIANKTFGDAPFASNATASSGLPVTLASLSTSICTTSGTTITIVGAGLCDLNSGQTGNVSFDAAPEVSRSFNIAKAAQSITFDTLSNKTFGDAPFALSATASSGLALAVTSLTADTCTVSGSTVTLVAAGVCAIAADQAGNGNYLAATRVSQGFTTAKGAQAISFPAIANRNVGTFNASATSSSGLPVSFDSQTPTVCTVSGATVTLLTAGICTLVASQAGDGNYEAAGDTSQTFTVTSSGGGGGGGCAMGDGKRVDLTLVLLCLVSLGWFRYKRRGQNINLLTKE